MGGGPVKKKPNPKPPVTMKGIFWSKIPNMNVDSTLWKDLSDEKIVIDEKLLMEHFSAKKSKAKKKTNEGEGKSEKPKEVKIVDGKKQQNAGIVISRLKMTTDELRNAVMNMDEDLLTPEKVGMLINIAPTGEETGALQGYDGDPALLGKVDQLLLELTKMEHFKEHMQCLSIKNQFKDQADVLNRLLDVCVSAVQELKNCKRFTKLLTVVLKMGNFMNGGSRRGGAFGIKLDVLNKIETAKSNSGKFTLVHFLVQQLQTIDPDVFKLVDELKSVSDAAKYTVGQLTGDFAAIRKSMKTVATEVEWAKKSEDANEFVSVFGPFSEGTFFCLFCLFLCFVC